MDERTLREWTAPWPGVAAEVKWEDDLAFGVAGRMFCVLCLRGADAGRISFKVDDDRFLAMTDRPGFAPATAGRAGGRAARARAPQLRAGACAPDEETAA